MEVSFQSAAEAYMDYEKADTLMSGYTIRFPSGVQEVDPLLMIKTIQDSRSMEVKMNYVAALINNKPVEIYLKDPDEVDDNGEVIKVYEPLKVMGFTFNGQGNLSYLFIDKPYLLQLLVDYCYAILLKKLTPPSRNSQE